LAALLTRRAYLDQPVFVLSIDTELAWGAFDRKGLESNSEGYHGEREIIRILLRLCDAYEIPAVWAIVGHLFLSSCSREGPDNHNHVLQPSYRWYPAGWLSHDPFSNVEAAPLFYAPDIIDSVRGASQPHEIASHTFTHAILGDPDCTREVAYSQLSECRRLGRARGMDIVSLVFPRNSVGHLDILPELGYLSFRGVEAGWYRAVDSRHRARQILHFLDRLAAPVPPCYHELEGFRRTSGTPWTFNLPASMFYAPFGGLWSLIPLSRRPAQARKGILEAVKRNALFHLWFHPFNLTTSPRLLDGLEEIFSFLQKLNRSGDIRCMTMGGLSLHLNAMNRR
jgi:hypothetical protein